MWNLISVINIQNENGSFHIFVFCMFILHRYCLGRFDPALKVKVKRGQKCQTPFVSWTISRNGTKHIKILCKGVVTMLHSATTYDTLAFQSFTKWAASKQLTTLELNFDHRRGGCVKIKTMLRSIQSLMILIMNQMKKLLFLSIQARQSHQKMMKYSRARTL